MTMDSQCPSSVVNPLCIILVKNGSKGDRLLFRYPYKTSSRNSSEEIGELQARNLSQGKFNSNNSTASTLQAVGSPSSPSLQSKLNLSNQQQPQVTSPGAASQSHGPGHSQSHPFAHLHHHNTSTSSTLHSSSIASGSPDTSIDSSSLHHHSANDTFTSGSGNRSASHSRKASLLSSRLSPPPTQQVPSTRRRNPYAVLKNQDDLFSTVKAFPSSDSSSSSKPPAAAGDRSSGGSNSSRGNSGSGGSSCVSQLGDLSDKDLSNLLAVNSELAERKFELKINEVRFVGHPTLMHSPKDVRPLNLNYQTSVRLFNIVFCLNARASHSIVKCFHDLSKRLGIGLRHEEYRCGFVSREMKVIIAKHDEACSHHADVSEEGLSDRENLFNEILASSNLAMIMKRLYDDVCQTGIVKLKINNWVQVSFCLPQKIHVLPFRTKAPLVEPENIHKCLEAIRPYHAILLLRDREELVASFWVDASSTIPRLLQVYSPLKSLQTMAADADLTLSQVVEIASHLVYWAAAVVIYPMCESNVYVLAPDAPITSPDLAAAFAETFSGVLLSQTLADFSLPMPLGERVNPMFGTSSQAQLVQLVCWLLKHRLLVQLHTYIYLSTYLDMDVYAAGTAGTTTEGSLNGRLSETGMIDEDGSLMNMNNMNMKLSLLQTFGEDEDDDAATVSDSFSEATSEDVRIGVSPIPEQQQQQLMINSVNNIPVPPGAMNEFVRPQQQQQQSTRPTSSATSDTTTTTNSTLILSDRDRDLTADPEQQQQAIHDSSSHEQPDNSFNIVKGTVKELQDPVKRAICQIKNPLTIHEIRMFDRLSKYFNGEFHLEEIMYRENVRRSQLMLLLDKFREVVITVEKEDADINFFKTPI